jgi:uncharacterized membrane protein
MFENSYHTIQGPTAWRRSLVVKTVGYRLLSVAVTALVAYVLLGDVAVAVDVGIWANLAKMGVYYAFEQAWAGIEDPQSA